MPTVFLVRHGENPANISKEFSYRTVDYSLNAKGLEQARQTAAFFQAQSIAIGAVYSSPLRRAHETAAVIATALGTAISIVEEFREINVGSLEGQTPTRELWDEHNAVLRAWLKGQPDSTFPAGENHHSVNERMQIGLRHVLKHTPQQASIIVGHGGIFTASLAAFCPDLDVRSIIRAPNHNCSLTELAVEERDGQLVGRVVRWADFGHLSGEAARFISGVFE